AAAIKACKGEGVFNAEKTQVGFALRDGQGKLLRKFLDTRGKRGLDQWSYYQDGFEVYRENDLNDDGNVEECRWLNAGGTRIGIVKSVQVEGGAWSPRIAGWKRISAEEASKVFVQALVTNDVPLLETVMATQAELTGLGLPPAMVAQVAD